MEKVFISLRVNCISGVMVSVLASSAVDRMFDPRSGKTKDCKIGICCFSAKHAALRRKSSKSGHWPWSSNKAFKGVSVHLFEQLKCL
jgi:hypothetical protein